MNVPGFEREQSPAHGAVQRLEREHRNIGMLVLLLESNFVAIGSGEDVDEPLLLDALTYMADFVDGFHHAKEQLAMEAVAGCSGEIDAARIELEGQHNRICEKGEWLRAALAQALRDEPVGRRELTETGLAYTGGIRGNMQVEEDIVFPALSEHLDNEAWGRIQMSIGHRADPLFGESVHERYAELFRELAVRFGLGDADAR